MRPPSILVGAEAPCPDTGGGGGNGILANAGKLLFAGDAGGNIVAYDPANG